MLRMLTTLAVAGVLAFGVTSSNSFAAQKKPTTKTCKAKTPEGKTKTWSCGANQACCVNPTFGLYVCGIPNLGCL